MKKFLFSLLIVVFTFSIAVSALAIDIDLSGMSDKELKQLRGQIDKELTSRAAANRLAGGDIGDYHIDILSIEMTKDISGSQAVLVNYLFTNNSKESASFWMDVTAKVFQDGIECNQAFTLDDMSSTMKDVQAGGSLEISRAYSLNNDYDDILIEIEEGLNFYKKSTDKLSFSLELP